MFAKYGFGRGKRKIALKTAPDTPAKAAAEKINIEYLYRTNKKPIISKV
jgi:hypothetical protein